MSQYAEQIGFAAGTLVGWRVDVLPNLAPVRFGIIQDVQLDFGADLKELYGQNRYAIALGAGKTKIEIKAKFAGIRGRLFNDLYFGTTSTAAQILLADNEAQQVPQFPFHQTSGDTPSGSVLPFTDTTGVFAGCEAFGTNVDTNTLVESVVASTSVTLSKPILGDIPGGTSISFTNNLLVTNAAGFITDMGVFDAGTGQPLPAGTFDSGPPAGGYSVDASTGRYFFDGSLNLPGLFNAAG